MRLAYSTKTWQGMNIKEHYEAAFENGFAGLEIDCSANCAGLLRNVDSSSEARELLRKLNKRSLQLAPLWAGSSMNLALLSETVAAAIDKAFLLRVPFVAFGFSAEATQKHMPQMEEFIRPLLKQAQEKDICLLIETEGCFADTKVLSELLDNFASDNLAALWNIHHTYCYAKETAAKTIENLGAYVKHVHMQDSYANGEQRVYCLMGEGDIPVKEALLALRSIDYQGFLSVYWTERAEIADFDIVLPHFINYMSNINTFQKETKLFDSKKGDGKYIWQQETLIDMTFSQMLDKVVETFPDQYAFRYTTLDYTRTYAEFRDDVDAFACSLLALGVKKGSKVAVWATNVPQWYIAFWATVKLGAVLVTVNTAYKIREAEYLLRQSDTHTLIMVDSYKDSNYVEIIKELCPELATADEKQPLHCKKLPFLRHIITVESKQKGCLTWEQAVEMGKKIPKDEVYRIAATVSPDDVCNMQYTSGTTGFPKGVMLTHYNVVNNGKCIGDRMDLSTADRMMIQVPMFHCFGMVLSMTASVTHGVTMCPLPYFSPKSSLACINQERITCFNGVPTMFIAMFNHADYKKTDFSHMRTGIMAGAGCPAELMRRANLPEEMHMEIISVYGQTEASPGCTTGNCYTDTLWQRTETVGKALPQIECKIIDPETGEDLPDGMDGEFVARGYNLMKGYYKMPHATAQAIDKDGWLHTGDLARRTPDGYYCITGRLKDMIIRGGENIYPKEIEDFLYTHPKIKDVQVIGVPDKGMGEEIMASIILNEGETLTEAEVKEYVNSHMAKHKTPRYVEFVDSFPMNAAGKILKYKMREEAAKKLGLDVK